MKVAHLPNSHLYHQHLIPALQAIGVEVDPRSYGWGTNLSKVLNEVMESRADVIHLHWPEALCGPSTPGLLQRVARRLHLQHLSLDGDWGRWVKETEAALLHIHAEGRNLIWTLHNLQPHGGTGLEREAYDRIYRTFAERADGVVHHSRWGKEQATSRYTFRMDSQHAVIPFGVFPDEAPDELTPAMARQALDLPEEELVLLTVGGVGPRKQLELIVDAVGSLESIPCRLLVVGGGNAEKKMQLSKQGKGRVQFLGKLDQARLSRYARAADTLVFAPKPDQLTTGGPHTSESFLKPQLTTETPYVKEVLGEAAIYFEPTVEGLQDALRAYARDPAATSERNRQIITKLAARRGAHSWAESARQTALLYTAVLEPETDPR